MNSGDKDWDVKMAEYNRPDMQPTTKDKVTYTAFQVRAMLRTDVTVYGSQKELANAIGISQQFLLDVLKGRREPSGEILKYLDLEREVRYVARVPF